MTIPNHITLDALRQMPIGDIVTLPAEEHYARGADQKRLAIAAHKDVEGGTE